MSNDTTAPAAAASAQAPPVAPTLVRLWTGVLLAPVSWVTDFLLRYMVVRFANAHARRWPFALSTAGGLLLLFVGVALCWRAHRDSRSHEEKTLASWGLALALFFFLLILCQAFPALILTPSELA
jgi:hypothetical protein